MQFIPNGTQIVIWGSGKIGGEIIEGKYGDYEICFIVDKKIKDGEKESISNIDIYPVSHLKNRGDKLVVLGFAKWREAATELEKNGLHIFREYVPYIYLQYDAIDIGFMRFCADDSERKKWINALSFGKKLCGLYGYCHMIYYKQCLIKCKEFMDSYCILDLPTANSNSVDSAYLNIQWIYSLLSILIVAKVYPDSSLKVPGWRMIKNWAKKECHIIVMTSAFFKGYFLQHGKSILSQTDGRIGWGDRNIDRLLQSGCTEQEIIQTISAVDFYRVDEVESFFENACETLEESDQKCDIKMCDIIRNYGRNERLMYSSTHPTERVMRILAFRLVREIGFSEKYLDEISDKELYSLKTHGEFIYPSVSNALGMKINENEKIYTGDDPNKSIDFREYVHIYMDTMINYES